MATREENLRKINDKLELLSDEQLDEIAGGLNDFDRPIVDFFLKQKQAEALRRTVGGLFR